MQRIADVPIYASDAIVRRAVSLQLTADAKAPLVGLPSALWQQLGLAPGAKVRLFQGGPQGGPHGGPHGGAQGEASAVLVAREDTTLAAGAVRVAAGHQATSSLGAMFGAITVERA